MRSLGINKNNIIFHTNLSEMPIEELNTEVTENIMNDYEIVVLNIEKFVSHIDNGTQYKIFTIDQKMKELIQFVKEGNQLIPPIIRNINDDKWTIFDGQHRIGLFIHLGIKCIPFLIRKDQIKYTQQLK